MTPPPIFMHACNLYNAFLAASFEADEVRAQEYGVKPGENLYIGHWSTSFVGRDDLPGESTQQKAYAWLQNTGCLEVLRRGGRDYPGVILLRHAPSIQDAAEGVPTDTRQLRNGKLGVVETAVQAHNGRINNLEDAVGTLSGQYNALIRDVEVELRKLSARMDEAIRNREAS